MARLYDYDGTCIPGDKKIHLRLTLGAYDLNTLNEYVSFSHQANVSSFLRQCLYCSLDRTYSIGKVVDVGDGLSLDDLVDLNRGIDPSRYDEIHYPPESYKDRKIHSTCISLDTPAKYRLQFVKRVYGVSASEWIRASWRAERRALAYLFTWYPGKTKDWDSEKMDAIRHRIKGPYSYKGIVIGSRKEAERVLEGL